MAFMDQFRRQNDLLQMPNQGGFGMMQSPFGQQQPMQQRGFGMFQSPWQQQPGNQNGPVYSIDGFAPTPADNGFQQRWNPQPGNMGYNPQQPQQSAPAFQQPQQSPPNNGQQQVAPGFGGMNPPQDSQNRPPMPNDPNKQWRFSVTAPGGGQWVPTSQRNPFTGAWDPIATAWV